MAWIKVHCHTPAGDHVPTLLNTDYIYKLSPHGSRTVIHCLTTNKSELKEEVVNENFEELSKLFLSTSPGR